MPPPAVIFIVGSVQARLEMASVLELNSIVRAAIGERPLDASVIVVGTEQQAQAMKAAARDAIFHKGVVTAVDVIDLR
jgi:hypothetical protein